MQIRSEIVRGSSARASTEHPVYMCPLLYNKCERIFYPIPKNGSSTMRKILSEKYPGNAKRLAKQDVYHLRGEYDVVAVIRHPYDRLSSCYHYFKQKSPNFLPFRSIHSYQEFLQMVILDDDDVANQHWRSQAGCLSLWGELLPTTYVRLGDNAKLGDLFGVQVYGGNTSNHARDGSDMPEEFKPYIDKRYAKDFELWELANDNGKL